MKIDKVEQYVAFISDFGTCDSYVAEMHSVLLEICPNVTIIDITHDIKPGDIKSAAYLIGRVKDRLPVGCIVVAVVDPGVGSSRQAVVISYLERFFIGPDNGIFSRVIMDESDSEVRILDDRDVISSGLSRTFHGRDLFTPVAGMLVSGRSFKSIGRLGKLEKTFPATKPVRKDTQWLGRVVYIDLFGNVITDIHHCLQGRVETGLSKNIIKAENYSDQPQGRVFWLNGSDGTVEISMNGESAAKHLGLEIGDPISLHDV